MSDLPFTTHGDEPVEARIVAWVLGEASAFEAAELERLCEERPELMIFKRRMLALHGLLAEAEKSQADESWKLSPEKRRAVEEILGEPQPIRLEVTKEKRIRRSGRRAFLAIAACVMLTVIVAGLLAPAGMRMRKKSDLSEARSNALQRQLALVDSEPRTQRLETALPKELIEGTPKPINVPNLEAPADGPAGSATWGMAARSGNESKRAGGEVHVGGEVNSPGPVPLDKELTLKEAVDSAGGVTAFGTNKRARIIRDGKAESYDLSSEEARNLRLQPGDTVELPQKRPWEVAGDPTPAEPSAPASSAPKTIVANTTSATAVPVPEVAADTPSLDFGDGADFGTGWGDAKNQDEGKPVGGLEIVGGAKLELQSGLRSGDGTVTGKQIDAIIDQPQVAAEGAKTDDYWDTSKAVAEGMNSGTKYELNTGYKSEYLFRGVDLGKDHDEGADKANNEQDLQLPRITTRSALAPDIAIEGAQKLRKLGKYDEAKKVLESTLSENPANQEVRDEIAKLDDPIRTNPALTYEHRQNVDGVRRGLHQAEGNYNLGKFDDAKREYEDVLRKDPYNQPARRGMERIAAAKSDYYRAAYDHTRAELLAEVDEEWEKAVPSEKFEGNINYGAPIGKDVVALPDDAEALAKAIRDQEDKVEERRKVLATIARTKGIIYKGQDSFYNQSGVDEDQGARSALETYHQLEQQKLQLESQINSLLKYDSEQLMVYAAGLDLPDNNVRQLYPKYLETKRQLEAEKAKGLGNDDPAVKAKVEQAEVLKRQLDESVINIRQTLGAQLDLASMRLKSVEAMKNQTREMALKRGLDAQDYVDAKREFEAGQELLQQMKLKLMRAKAETPKPDLTKLLEEISAAEEPYSTFSLNISDASFRIAQAAMDKGERPDPAGIKVEQFYNAVDYGDPSPAAAQPVSCAIEQAAHPVIPGRNLLRIALKTAAAGRAATQPLRLTLLVDQSGSMTRADRRAAMDAAMASLGKLLTDKDLVNIVGFSRTSRLVADGMKGDEAGKKLAELVNQSASEGGTNLETAIDLAGQMAQRRMLAGAQNRIVLFTDGAANLGDADPQRLAAKVEQLRQQGVAFDIAGIAADGLNDELLGELARKGNGRYYVVSKNAEEDFAKQLAGAFRPAAENVKVQVRFNPERVTRYKLIGFEKDRLKTEDFRNDKVDAAELAAEEAGVAIYQIEPNPDGSGEIGEVSVRFRDTASGEMVERGWTMPHDAAAPAIDRATPSMQLALLSMFAAEKLKGGPLGDAIDFRQLAEAQANVKQFFGGNARVAEVLRMVEMLK